MGRRLVPGGNNVLSGGGLGSGDRVRLEVTPEVGDGTSRKIADGQPD
jgi:hypothetical protein